jgi:alpha-N-arabinofuranosidase
MKSLSILFVLPVVLLMVSGSFAADARIKIDRDRVIGEISPLIYGNFVEHLGRCVYGGVYDPGSPLSDENGLRKDVLEAAKDLNVTIVRYPGGNFVSNYHWEDGVGPERIPRMELAWRRLEPNTFGTNEFMDFVTKLGAEPYFAVNMGTGTIEEAQR